MPRSLAVAAGLVVLAAPASASAAELTVNPQKRCYSSGETVNLIGSGFSPLGSATVTRDGSPLGSLSTDGNGAFNGTINYGAMKTALSRGYEVSSTDTGHTGGSASFGLGHPEKVIDFGWRAVHETANSDSKRNSPRLTISSAVRLGST